MKRLWQTVWVLPVLTTGGLLGSLWCAGRADAQPFASLPGSRFDLSETIQLDWADSTVLDHDLERVKALLADQQWDDAIETLRAMTERSEGKLLGVTDDRYVPLRDYCHLQLAALPAEALQQYRSRVDPLAEKWYTEGVARRDARLLSQVVDQAFASSWGDDALMALGEMALESGRYAEARWCWERIVPAQQPADAPPTWPGYPDTDLDLAAVRARLVLTSILEGALARARDDLAQFVRSHGTARGHFGGREVNYAEELNDLLTAATTWPEPEAGPDWLTFAGNTSRGKVAPKLIDVGKVAWRIPLPTIAARGGVYVAAGVPPRVVAEDPAATLSYHPLLTDDLVLAGTLQEILAVRLSTGKPAWGQATPTVYRAQLEGAAGEPSDPPNALGVPRCTMTVHGDMLYARMGTAVTSCPQEATREIQPGYLVCLDLAAQGRLMWKIVPEEGFAFEGSPVVDSEGVYVALRRSDVRPQAHVACFDARSGRRRWRSFVCGAETPTRGVLYQKTHNLLTLRRGTLYFNTNLGAMAALSTADGHVRWVSLYPRQRQGDLSNLALHWQRDLNPCVYHRGTLLVAPADSPKVFAVDAATGQLLWKDAPEVPDAVHLLGTTENHLIAAGEKLYWIGLRDQDRGRVKHVWPDGREKLGYGRGVLAGDSVLWPSREKVYVFDAKTARPRKVIDLASRGAGGGNLLVAGGGLLVATGTELIALSPLAGKPDDNPELAGEGTPLHFVPEQEPRALVHFP